MTKESNPEQDFQKALLLLDRETDGRAEGLLRAVIAAAKASDDQVLLTRALCVFGDWLAGQERQREARERLREALGTTVPDEDVVAYERRRAADLLRSLGT